MPLSHLFVSKNRIIHFELSILIEDLTNVPLVSGLYYVKYKVKNATNGSTMRAPIRDHSIYWGCPINTDVELIVSKQQMLGPCDLKLEVYQELGGKETTLIGDLVINLSEYASTGLTARRYLLDHCKFNSTIKLSITVNQKSDNSIPFNIPPLKKQQIFTDIPAMFLEKNQDNATFDKRSLYSAHNSNSNLFQQNSPLLKKSQSTVSLPHYYKQFSDDPSPTDLVEQLFKQKPSKTKN